MTHSVRETDCQCNSVQFNRLCIYEKVKRYLNNSLRVTGIFYYSSRISVIVFNLENRNKYFSFL